jgi:hypothetical protein
MFVVGNSDMVTEQILFCSSLGFIVVGPSFDLAMTSHPVSAKKNCSKNFSRCCGLSGRSAIRNFPTINFLESRYDWRRKPGLSVFTASQQTDNQMIAHIYLRDGASEGRSTNRAIALPKMFVDGPITFPSRIDGVRKEGK